MGEKTFTDVFIIYKNKYKLVNLLFNEIAPRFAKRNSGFTRIIGLGKRRGDNAEMVIFEFTELKKKEIKKEKTAKEEKPQIASEDAEQKKESKIAIKDNPIDEKKPQKKFMGGLRTIFKKKSDSL